MSTAEKLSKTQVEVLRLLRDLPTHAGGRARTGTWTSSPSATFPQVHGGAAKALEKRGLVRYVGEHLTDVELTDDGRAWLNANGVK